MLALCQHCTSPLSKYCSECGAPLSMFGVQKGFSATGYMHQSAAM
jgi:predicted amidophosphoribosyltransferase